MRLFDFLFPPRADELALREVSLDEFLAYVSPHVVPITRPETVILFSFGEPTVRATIHEAKYHGNAQAFTYLGTALTDYLRDADVPKTRFDLENSGLRSNLVLVPVPLGRARKKERGFNQVEEVAKRAARELDIPLDTTLLTRTRETTSQVSLERKAREENMRGAFKATRRADPARTYIIIDDVITTGATLGAAIETLKDAGASHIIPLALAH